MAGVVVVSVVVYAIPTYEFRFDEDDAGAVVDSITTCALRIVGNECLRSAASVDVVGGGGSDVRGVDSIVEMEGFRRAPPPVAVVMISRLSLLKSVLLCVVVVLLYVVLFVVLYASIGDSLVVFWLLRVSKYVLLYTLLLLVLVLYIL